MVLIQDLACAREIEVVRRRDAPRQRRDPVQVRADDAVLRGGGRQSLEPSELAGRRLFHFLRQVERIDAVAQLVRLGLFGIALAELLLDRFQLLTQEELALPLLELRLDLRLDLAPELDHLELAVEDDRHFAQALADVDELEQLLLLVRLQTDRRRDEAAQRARVVDVRSRDLELLRQIRDEADDPAELVLHVAGQCLEFLRLGQPVGELRHLGDEIGVVTHVLCDADAPEALHEHAQRAVGDADHLVHDRGGADGVDVVPAGDLRVLVRDGDEREQAVAGDDVVDERYRPLLSDRERRHRRREDDRLLQRQDGQRRGQLIGELLGELLLLRADGDDLAHSAPSSGRTMRSIPRSYVAEALETSTSSPSSSRRWNAPYSISICR